MTSTSDSLVPTCSAEGFTQVTGKSKLGQIGCIIASTPGGKPKGWNWFPLKPAASIPTTTGSPPTDTCPTTDTHDSESPSGRVSMGSSPASSPMSDRMKSPDPPIASLIRNPSPALDLGPLSETPCNPPPPAPEDIANAFTPNNKTCLLIAMASPGRNPAPDGPIPFILEEVPGDRDQAAHKSCPYWTTFLKIEGLPRRVEWVDFMGASGLSTLLA